MRKILISFSVAATVCALVTTPAAALGLGDLAKVVLGNGSVLKKGQAKCGSSFGLTQDDSSAISLARSAVQKSLPLSQFTALDKAAEADATKAASAPTFCNETKKKKSGLMKAMSKAGKSILKQGALGGLGI